MRSFKASLFAVFALGVLLRAPTFGRSMLSDDEAIYATTADALGRGDLLYRDVVDHKPPLIYHVYQAGFAALGRYDTRGAHALVILSVLVTAACLLAIKRREDGDGPGLAAAGLFLVFSTTWHDYDALAANCELFLLAPQAAAAWLLMRDLSGGTPARGARGLAIHLAVGALIGTSALFKYQGLTFLGASVGMLAWGVLVGRGSRAWAVSRAVCHVAGALAPAALYLAWCAVAGNAEAAVYWFKFNFSYVGAGLTGVAALARGLRRTLLIGSVAIVPYALGIAAAVGAVSGVARVIRGQRDATGAPPPTVVLGVLWLLTSAISVAAGGRFFGHYFHLVLAPLCLLAAPAFHRAWTKGWRTRAPLAALCALPALAFFALATFARPLAASVDEREPAYDHVASRIAALATPDERIFVWGNSPQLYVAARRPMGTRFSFCNYMTGESPGTPTESGQRNADANQLPAAWDMLFADLERLRPALFVDAAAAGWDGYGKYPLARYPRLRAYVDAHYRQIDECTGVVLYRRLR
ncbi:MAG TPA: hypothetical protein VN903_06190 [Polyangia bacterium]|jgi:hypothetical protein|nr:hypothetical protein [Polyangia bacterium]